MPLARTWSHVTFTFIHAHVCVGLVYACFAYVYKSRSVLYEHYYFSGHSGMGILLEWPKCKHVIIGYIYSRRVRDSFVIRIVWKANRFELDPICSTRFNIWYFFICLSHINSYYTWWYSDFLLHTMEHSCPRLIFIRVFITFINI